MSKEISNPQIENATRNIGDEDSDDSFIGVFLQNVWIDLLTIQLWYLRKKENILSLLLTLTAVKNVGCTGGVY